MQKLSNKFCSTPHFNLTRKKLVNYSGIISLQQAVASISYLDWRHEILQSFSGTLFDPKEDSSPIKQSMAMKIAESGLSYSNLRELYLNKGTKGLLAIIHHSPSHTLLAEPFISNERLCGNRVNFLLSMRKVSL